ncbi:MAG: DUF1826 domain-containing protein [Geminicoccaceae bacterium]
MNAPLPVMLEADDDLQDGTVIEVASLDDLAAIHQPAHSLALCPRNMPPALAPWLDGLPDETLPHERLPVRVGDAPLALAELFDSASLPKDGPAQTLRDDMVDLIERFALLADLQEVDVRVELIRHDACKRFHRDHVRLRLICCYQGPTTEWVPSDYAKDALEGQRDYAGPLQHFPRFAVAVFKGHEQGVVHRSPAIADAGKTRFLLCLNEPSTVSPSLWQAT